MMNNKYRCFYCVGCPAQEDKNWIPKRDCKNYRDDGRKENHIPDAKNDKLQ